MRQSFVKRLAVWCVLFSGTCVAGGPEAGAVAKAVEARYNRSESLRLSFSETYAGKGHPVQNESGVLYLRKPGRMRWEYTAPAGKVFLSDGKNVYLYAPEEHKAEKGKLKESEDMRAPLAFLLGKLDFAKEFRSLETRKDGADTWIVAQPKSPNLAYTQVEFRALPSGEIRQVRVTGQDQSKLEFTFSGEVLNAPVAPGMFVFHAPPGVQVVETEQ